ncbi:MAG: peptidylprolyl isomerase [Campylobacterales bacterium]|nr:peptidylprolyl isomerase [Campylobacterales bacterium]
MSIVEDKNSVVSISYEVTQAGQNEVIDSNRDHAPLEFITGHNHIIIGLEKALVGMKKGESGDMLVKANEAYGEHDPEAIQTLPIEQFNGIELAEGMILYGQGEAGQTVQVTVKSFTDSDVVIDYNHPLAGKDLMFSVSILDCREATADEALTGEVAGSKSGCCGGGSCGDDHGHHHHDHNEGGCGCH